MNFSRHELVKAEATMNQMRNSVYHLQRFLKLNNVPHTDEVLQRMGKNIALSFIKYWKPIEKVTKDNIKEVMVTLYKFILDSTISIELDEYQQQIKIKDNDCPLCKYHFEDIQSAGCEIIISMMSEIILLINGDLNQKDCIFIKPLKIDESRTKGDKYCSHLYNYSFGGK
jgi:hypothetical protein